MCHQSRIFAVDDSRSPARFHVSERGEWNDFSGVSNDGESFELVQTLSQISLVPNPDGIALAAFNGARDVAAPQSRFHDLIDHRGRHSVTSRVFTVNVEFKVRLAEDNVRIHRSRFDLGQSFEVGSDVERGLSQALKTIAVNPYCHGRFDAALQHHHPTLNGLQRRCWSDTW